MAYSPLGGPGTALLGNPALARIGAAHKCSAAAVALAWTIRSGRVIAIPESGSADHVKENAVALSLALTPQDLKDLDDRVSTAGPLKHAQSSRGPAPAATVRRRSVTSTASTRNNGDHSTRNIAGNIPGNIPDSTPGP